MRRWLMAFGLMLPLHAHAAGLQWPVIAPDPDGEPLQVAIFYPSHTASADVALMKHDMRVARDGMMDDSEHHPLIVFSHGVTGSPFDNSDTAIALADAGFIVAAVMHTHDNRIDHSGSFTATNIADRPRHLRRTIDMMLTTWKDRADIDPERIGVFGYSAGGASALFAIGAQADLGAMSNYCAQHAADLICIEHSKVKPEKDGIVVTGDDPRIRAAVLASPALSAAFVPSGLRKVTVPIQLWIGGKDSWVPQFDYANMSLSEPLDYHFVPNAEHHSFAAPCARLATLVGWVLGHGGCEEADGFNRAAFHTTFNANVIEFFHTHLIHVWDMSTR